MLTSRSKFPKYFKGDNTHEEIITALEVFTLHTGNGEEVSVFIKTNQAYEISKCDYPHCSKYKKCNKYYSCVELKAFNNQYTERIPEIKAKLLL